MILISHRLNDVFEVTDRIVVLHQGRIEAALERPNSFLQYPGQCNCVSKRKSNLACFRRFVMMWKNFVNAVCNHS